MNPYYLVSLCTENGPYGHNKPPPNNFIIVLCIKRMDQSSSSRAIVYLRHAALRHAANGSKYLNTSQLID